MQMKEVLRCAALLPPYLLPLRVIHFSLVCSLLHASSFLSPCSSIGLMISPSSTREYGVLQDEELFASSPTSRREPKLQSNNLTPITTKQILYLILFQGVGSGVVNFVINFLLAYAMYRNVPNNIIAFSHSLTCVVSDVTVTSFLIPCLTGIIGSFLIKNDLRVGKLVTPIDSRYLRLPILKMVPGNDFVDIIKRSVLFGFIGLVVFMPITLFIIYPFTILRYMAGGGSGVGALWTYVVFKGCWSALEAAILSPILAFISISIDTTSSELEIGGDLSL